MNRFSFWCRIAIPCFVLLTGPAAFCQDDVEEVAATTEVAAEEISIPVEFIVHNLWIMIAGMLVFIMHLGFATLESGLTRSKNTVNILFKNSMIVCIGFLTYMVVGFNLMYPGFEDPANGFFKFAGFGFMMNGTEQLSDPAFASPVYNEGYTAYTDFFFQAMFAATCATIVSYKYVATASNQNGLNWSKMNPPVNGTRLNLKLNRSSRYTTGLVCTFADNDLRLFFF